jgi:hypothetical protein
MPPQKLNNDLYRTLVLTILAGLATVTVAMANRDVYSKEEINAKFIALKERDRAIERQLEHIESDVQWLVRKEGGVPSAAPQGGDRTP